MCTSMVENKDTSEIENGLTDTVKQNDAIDDGSILNEQAQVLDANGQKVGKPDEVKRAKEINGPKGLEPTRYGDWESKGRCHDF